MIKNWKSLFVTEVDDKKTAAAPTTKSSGDDPSEKTINPPFQIPETDGQQGQIQDKFLEVLFKALEGSNQEGFDYMEFKDFLKSLANVPMDDSTRYKSAFATAQTMGATKENILQSARHYLQVLAKEDAKFQEALKGQQEKNLTSKQEDIRNLEKSIKQKEADIEKQKNEIETHRQEIKSMETEMEQASVRITQTAQDFQATYQALLEQIEADVRHIETHL